MTVMQSSVIQLQSVQYNDAIKYYADLRKKFINDYAKAAQLTRNDAIAHIKKNLINQIEQSDLNATSQKYATELYDWIGAQIKSKIENSEDSAVKKQRGKIRKLYKTSKEEGEKAARELAEGIVSAEELANYIKSQLTASGVAQGFSISDILAHAISYRNKIIASPKKSTKQRINIVKGYYNEALVFKAFSTLSEHLDTMQVEHTGSVKKGGKDTEYDLYAEFIKPMEQFKTFNTIITEEIPDSGYGIQSKSWLAPWENSNKYSAAQKYGLSVGSRKGLLNECLNGQNPTGSYAWLKGIYFLEQNAVRAIGERQVAYTTGKNFYWTANLISQLRNQLYFLAFTYKKNKELSASVKWQHISAFDPA